MAHAWLEIYQDGRKLAIDTTWMLAQPAKLYRRNLKLKYVVEYTASEFTVMWRKAGMPGPYDDKIKAKTKEGKASNGRG